MVKPGLLVPPHDADALVAALDALLNPATGPSLRRRLGDAGRCSTARFEKSRQLDGLQALYSELLESPTGIAR